MSQLLPVVHAEPEPILPGSDAVPVLGKVLRVAGPAHGPDPPGPRVRVLRLVLGRCPSVPPPADWGGRAGP